MDEHTERGHEIFAISTDPRQPLDILCKRLDVDTFTRMLGTVHHCAACGEVVTPDSARSGGGR